MVRKRRKRYPNMHIYHYAPYEKTALLRLAGRYGVGEDEVDDLLRNGVLVDLFPLVRKCIRVGADELQPQVARAALHGQRAAHRRRHHRRRLDQRRTPTTATCATEGRSDEAEIVLKEIEDYNRYDCRSTHRLRDWLIEIAHRIQRAATRPAAGALPA